MKGTKEQMTMAMAMTGSGSGDGNGKKRSVVRVLEESDGEDVFEVGLLDGALDGSGDDDEDEEEDEEQDEDEDEAIDSSGEGSEEEEDEEEEEEEEESGSEGGAEGEVQSSANPPRTIALDSAGNQRYIYPPIDPVYDSDDSDAEEANTIGNIPLGFYDEYPHVGYDINGTKIMRPAKGAALDALLDSIEVPKGWTGLTDKSTGEGLKLTDEELEMVRKIQMDENVLGYDPYQPTVEYFTSRTEVMPLSAAPEPKRRFIPSKHEAKRIMKLVTAMRLGHIVPSKPKTPSTPTYYDIWADDLPAQALHIMSIPAPKLPPPTHDESYNPPPEYLPTPQERDTWASLDPDERDKDYLPRTHSALRLVPGYDAAIKERFERCLDLYLAPRVRRNKLNIDPDSLLPKLPSPRDLRPFPTMAATVYRGHDGRVRTLSCDPSGVWLATGGDDGTVRLWEILTGREVWKAQVGEEEEAVRCVRWRPGREEAVLAVACGEEIHLIIPPLFDPVTISASRALLAAGWGHAQSTASKASTTPTKPPPATWRLPSPAQQSSQHTFAIITTPHPLTHLSFHRRGAYLCSVAPTAHNSAVLIHHLPTHASQTPFRRARGTVAAVEFHPFKPHLFVATQRYIRVYDLAAQTLLRTLQPGARWISGFDIHPAGDNVLVSAYDRRVLWHDLDLSPRPYKTLRYHERAVRAVRFHQGAACPLFASASDDGTVQVFYGRVVADLLENAVVVPLKVLRGHRVVGSLGVLEVEWHTREPWVFSAGADGTVRLWV